MDPCRLTTELKGTGLRCLVPVEETMTPDPPAYRFGKPELPGDVARTCPDT